MSEVVRYTTERAAADLPQTTQSALFTVSDYITVHYILGVVSGTAIQNQANDTKLVANPTTGTDTDICAVLDIANDALGQIYTVTGDFSDAMVDGGAVGAVEGETSLQSFIVAPGTIDLNCAASNTGKIKWTIVWSPIMANASVTAA